MDRKPLKEIREKDGLRGLVPSSGEGKRDEVYATYLETIEVETDVDVQLALAQSTDPRFTKFLELMSTPSRTTKIQTVAKQCGIDLIEFGNWYNKSITQIAIGRAQRAAVGIVSHMSKDALTKDEFCERCDGLGWVAAPEGLPMETTGYRMLGFKQTEEGDKVLYCRTCPKCKGSMSVPVVGDEHSRNKILEIAGLTTKGGKGTSVQINLGGAAHASAVTGSLSNMTIDIEAEEVPDE